MGAIVHSQSWRREMPVQHCRRPFTRTWPEENPIFIQDEIFVAIATTFKERGSCMNQHNERLDVSETVSVHVVYASVLGETSDLTAMDSCLFLVAAEMRSSLDKIIVLDINNVARASPTMGTKERSLFNGSH
jgi:hypothetical protein